MSQSNKQMLRRIAPFASIAAVIMLGLVPWVRLTAAEDARVMPAPAVDGQAAKSGSEVAVLAGGCFWGVQGVFQHVTGVTQAVSGYAGGSEATAVYETVTTGMTGHAEAVQITFDPGTISYGRLLQ